MAAIHPAPVSATRIHRERGAQPRAAARPDRNPMSRRSLFQRWLAETRTQEVTLDQRVLDLCG